MAWVLPLPGGPTESITWSWKLEERLQAPRAHARESITWSWKVRWAGRRWLEMLELESITWSWKREPQSSTSSEQCLRRNPLHGVESIICADQGLDTLGLGIHYMELKGIAKRHQGCAGWIWRIHYMELKVPFQHQNRSLVLSTNPLHGVES
jgi:hypothetical protein